MAGSLIKDVKSPSCRFRTAGAGGESSSLNVGKRGGSGGSGGCKGGICKNCGDSSLGKTLSASGVLGHDPLFVLLDEVFNDGGDNLTDGNL